MDLAVSLISERLEAAYAYEWEASHDEGVGAAINLSKIFLLEHLLSSLRKAPVEDIIKFFRYQLKRVESSQPHPDMSEEDLYIWKECQKANVVLMHELLRVYAVRRGPEALVLV